MQRPLGRISEVADLAAEPRQLTDEREHRRRLAGAIGPEQGYDLALVDRQVEIVDDTDVAVTGAQPHGFEHRGAHARAPISLASTAVDASVASPR
jgi:hypothetical protein